LYTLIGNPKNRAFRVLWMLEELGLEYDLVPANPRSEELKAVNPSGKSPVFKDGDEVIIDSTAIIQYLADKHGRFTFASGTIERAKQDSFTCFALDDLDGILWNDAKHGFILPEELRSKEVRPACEHDLAKSFLNLKKRLGDNQYLMGDEMTVPDIITEHCARWAVNAKHQWPAGNLTDYVERLRSRPAYIKADEIRKNI